MIQMSNDPLHFSHYPIIINGDMSGNITSSVTIDDVTTSSYNIDSIRSYCVQAFWSGSAPVGSLSLNGSLDGINFVSVATLSVSGNTGSDMFNVEFPAYSYVQLVYTFTSGTGTMQASIN